MQNIPVMTQVSSTRARLQATVALAGGLVLWWRLGGLWPAAIAGLFAALAVLAWFAPRRHAPVQRVFDAFTRLLVAGFSWLVLGVVYFGFFTPLRWIGSGFGRDPLRLRPNRGAATYLRALPPASAGRFGRQY